MHTILVPLIQKAVKLQLFEIFYNTKNISGELQLWVNLHSLSTYFSSYIGMCLVQLDVHNYNYVAIGVYSVLGLDNSCEVSANNIVMESLNAGQSLYYLQLYINSCMQTTTLLSSFLPFSRTPTMPVSACLFSSVYMYVNSFSYIIV